MTEKLAWNEFKQTGDISAYLKFRELQKGISINEASKGEWNNNRGK